MFKKRSRPASVRNKDVTDVVEDDASAVTSTASSREDTPEGQTVEQMILIRKLRRGQQGIDLEKFNRGEEKKKPKDTVSDLDQFGLQQGKGSSSAGGIQDETEQLARKVRANNFTQQTNALDVNKHMMAFIETEMAKKKGITEDDEQKVEQDPQAELYGLAERYKVEAKRLGEDQEGNVTSSLGMLSAIPEVDLGMDNRLRNIEETEKAKRELLERRAKEKRDRERDDDPLASTRFFRGRQQQDVDIGREMEKARREAAGISPRERRERDPRTETSTDDVVFERFKKRIRR